MSCDEKVMGVLGSEIRQDYSHTLLSLAVRERGLLPGSLLAFGESHVKSRIKNVLGFKKPAFYLLVTTCLVIGILGFSLLSNPDSFDTDSFNMAENFTPLGIEMEINEEMHFIEFAEREKEYIADLLEYDTWQKANSKHGLSTTTYLEGEEGKVIGLYENVEGYTYIQLYQGFGRRNNTFYQAPGYIFATLRENLFWEYTDPTRSWPWLDTFVRNYQQPSQYEFRYMGSETILYHDNQKVRLLIYDDWAFSKDNLRAEILEISIADGSEHVKEVYLPEDLLGYYFFLDLHRNATFQKYLLGIRWSEDEEEKKLYSDLFVLDKDTLREFTILQSHEADFDPGAGGMLHFLPEEIHYTVRLVDDFIIYQDTDLFWKVQDVRNGEIYTSPVQETSDAHVYYDAGEYIYILRYLDDGSALAFDKAGKDFLMLPYPDPVEAYPLEKIYTASFKNLPGENILLELSEEEISALKHAFNDSFHTIRELVQHPPIPLQSPPDLVLEVNTGYKERINIYEIVGRFHASYVEFLEGSEFVITNYILLSPELQEFFDASRKKFPQR